MAEAKSKKHEGNGGGTEQVAAPGGAAQPKSARLDVRLVPVGNSDQPVVANYCSISVSPGIAFIDFGFLEPGMLAALPRLAREGGKLPERLNGKLAVRVALGYDAIAGLHQQIGRVLTGLRQQQASGSKKNA